MSPPTTPRVRRFNPSIFVIGDPGGATIRDDRLRDHGDSLRLGQVADIAANDGKIHLVR